MPAAATILIVDDYPDSLDVWDLYLSASGFDLVLIKPCDPAELVDAIRRHLDAAPARHSASPEQ